MTMAEVSRSSWKRPMMKKSKRRKKGFSGSRENLEELHITGRVLFLCPQFLLIILIAVHTTHIWHYIQNMRKYKITLTKSFLVCYFDGREGKHLSFIHWMNTRHSELIYIQVANIYESMATILATATIWI